MDDFSKNIKATLYERLASPFYGAFAFSWLYWNWDFLYFMLWDEGMETRERLSYGIAHYSSFNHTIVCPILSALLVIGIGTPLSVLVYRYWKWLIEIQRRIRDSLEGTRRLSLNDSQKITSENRELRNELKRSEDLLTNSKEKHQRDIQERNNRITQIEQEIEDLTPKKELSDQEAKEKARNYMSTRDTDIKNEYVSKHFRILRRCSFGSYIVVERRDQFYMENVDEISRMCSEGLLEFLYKKGSNSLTVSITKMGEYVLDIYDRDNKDQNNLLS